MEKYNSSGGFLVEYSKERGPGSILSTQSWTLALVLRTNSIFFSKVSEMQSFSS